MDRTNGENVDRFAGRRSGDRRKADQPFDGLDRRSGERRSGADRRQTERRSFADRRDGPDHA
ncbi:MAG: hypothetical protein V2I27_08130 [Erythrobacter sp.]|nr:hypothetical protein [Erythrobacter sp.]